MRVVDLVNREYLIRQHHLKEICHYLRTVFVCTNVFCKGVARYETSTIFIGFFADSLMLHLTET